MITTEPVVAAVMKTRACSPIGNVWSKIPRMVRDLCLDVDKDVRLVMEGKDTELDKTLLEAIKDPLVHIIIRNSVDHGVEHAPRVEAGKPEAGMLTLRAYHEGGKVNLEISDDGKGVCPTGPREGDRARRGGGRGGRAAERQGGHEPRVHAVP